jgi:hypothetical protein
MELLVAGSIATEMSMRTKPKLIDLVCKYLPAIVVTLEVINQVLELVNKVVNYGSPLSELRLFIRTKREAFLQA